MSEFVHFGALFLAAILATLAVGYAQTRLASRLIPSVNGVPLGFEHAAVLLGAVLVFASLVAVAVAFPYSAVGFFALTPERVEVSAIVTALAGAMVQSFRQQFSHSPRPVA